MAVSANEASGRRLSAIPPSQHASDRGNGPTGTLITTPSGSFLSFVLSCHFILDTCIKKKKKKRKKKFE